jgi:hypothetical protein
MIKQNAVRLSLIAMTAVAGLLSAGSANATDVFEFGKDCENPVGFAEPDGLKMCNTRTDIPARVRCTHLRAGGNVVQVLVSADNFRSDNNVNCSVVGRLNGQITFIDGSFGTRVGELGGFQVAESDVFNRDADELILECTLQPNVVGQPANCLDNWNIVN